MKFVMKHCVENVNTRNVNFLIKSTNAKNTIWYIRNIPFVPAFDSKNHYMVHQWIYLNIHFYNMHDAILKNI